MPYSQSTALGRRISFWDNTIFHIHQILKDTDAETANKWPEDKDTTAMSNIIAMLKMVEIIAISRYQEVLTDKIAELKGEQTQEADYGKIDV